MFSRKLFIVYIGFASSSFRAFGKRWRLFSCYSIHEGNKYEGHSCLAYALAKMNKVAGVKRKMMFEKRHPAEVLKVTVLFPPLMKCLIVKIIQMLQYQVAHHQANRNTERSLL